MNSNDNNSFVTKEDIQLKDNNQIKMHYKLSFLQLIENINYRVIRVLKINHSE